MNDRRLPYPPLYLTARKRTADWLIRVAASGLSEAAPKIYIHESSYKRLSRRIHPRRAAENLHTRIFLQAAGATLILPTSTGRRRNALKGAERA